MWDTCVDVGYLCDALCPEILMDIDINVSLRVDARVLCVVR